MIDNLNHGSGMPSKGISESKTNNTGKVGIMLIVIPVVKPFFICSGRSPNYKACFQAFFLNTRHCKITASNKAPTHRYIHTALHISVYTIFLLHSFRNRGLLLVIILTILPVIVNQFIWLLFYFTYTFLIYCMFLHLFSFFSRLSSALADTYLSLFFIKYGLLFSNSFYCILGYKKRLQQNTLL